MNQTSLARPTIKSLYPSEQFRGPAFGLPETQKITGHGTCRAPIAHFPGRSVFYAIRPLGKYLLPRRKQTGLAHKKRVTLRSQK